MAMAQGQTPAGAAPAAQPSRAQQLMGATAPKLAELTDGVLYADIWERPDQLRSHLKLARQNGVTKEELVETITHMAFYYGWPSAVSAVAIAKEVFED